MIFETATYGLDCTEIKVEQELLFAGTDRRKPYIRATISLIGDDNHQIQFKVSGKIRDDGSVVPIRVLALPVSPESHELVRKAI